MGDGGGGFNVDIPGLKSCEKNQLYLCKGRDSHIIYDYSLSGEPVHAWILPFIRVHKIALVHGLSLIPLNRRTGFCGISQARHNLCVVWILAVYSGRESEKV